MFLRNMNKILRYDFQAVTSRYSQSQSPAATYYIILFTDRHSGWPQRL